MQNDFSGKCVVVAGGSSGMGLALVERLATDGAVVTVLGRNAERLSAVHEKLGDNVETLVCDITDEDQVAAAFAGMGEIDHIVTTAAEIEGAYRLLPDIERAAAQRVVESKFYGPLFLAKHGAPKLRANGSITYTSGIAAYRPSARGSVVAAVNAALEGLVRALAVELAPIRINAVSPGWVDTPIWSFVAGEAKDATLRAMAERLPVGRVGAPEDIAGAILFLMENSFTTGSVLHVEGGHRLI